MRTLIIFCVFGSFLFGAGYYAGSSNLIKTDDEVISIVGLNPQQVELMRIYVQQNSGTTKTETKPKKNYFDFSYPEKKAGTE
ncbi:MAG: hypothetical protein QM488_01480 [Rhizobiaceae bacterium]